MQETIKRFNSKKEGKGYGCGVNTLSEIVRLIASTNTKEAWNFLVYCFCDDDYDAVRSTIAHSLCTTLYMFHEHKEEAPIAVKEAINKATGVK